MPWRSVSTETAISNSCAEVYLLDVNVLIAAHRDDHGSHADVREWLTGAVAEPTPGFAVVDLVASGFVRVSTNPRIFAVPTPIDDAFAFLDSLVTRPTHSWLGSGRRVYDLFRDNCLAQRAVGDLVPDAYLAALARKHASTLVSMDRDFARFDDLDWLHPLA